MTFVIGFKSGNGIVICTDSLEADGLTKRYVNKTRIINSVDWSVAIAGAGPGGLLDKFTADVAANIHHGEYNRKQIEETIEDALSRFRNQYQEPFRILVGVKHTDESLLYRSDDNYLVPIKDHAHVGMGHSLWRFLSESLYNPGNSVEDNSRLAIFIMRQAIEYVDGVDGPIRLATCTFGDSRWEQMTGPHFPKLENWREGYSHCEVRTALRNEWRRTNPPSMSEQARYFGAVRTPGDELTFLDGVKMEGLGSVSGRRKAANSFWCNRDRLRKRANLEQERSQEQEKDRQQQ